MSNRYDVGDTVRATGTFTDPLNSDAAIDPAAVYVTVTDPSDNATTYQYGTDAEVVRSDAGVYYIDIDLDEAGKWTYRWYSTGTGKAAEKSTLIADPTS